MGMNLSAEDFQAQIENVLAVDGAAYRRMGQMGSRSKKPKALRQIEECMNNGLMDVNDGGELVMSHPDKFTKSEIDLLKIWFGKVLEEAKAQIG